MSFVDALYDRAADVLRRDVTPLGFKAARTGSHSPVNRLNAAGLRSFTAS